MPFEASQAVFRSLSSQKESKLSKTFVYKSSTGLAFIPDAKLQVSKFGHAEKAKFRESFAALSSFTFCFLSSPLLLLFFPHFFFFCWSIARLPFGGKRFCKKFEDREFVLKEVQVGSGTRFSLEFSGQSHTVFCVFLWSV